MKRIIFVASLLSNVVLLYKLNENKKDLYDLSERAKFYKQQFDENTKN